MLEQARARLVLMGLGFALACLIVIGRLTELALATQFADPAPERAAAPIALGRAEIVDRNGRVLATSLPMSSLFVDPAKVIDAKETARKLTAVLPGLSTAEIERKIAVDNRFMWLKRDLTPRQRQAVHELGLPGLGFREEEKRIYPAANATAHVVGFTDVDDHGKGGVEESFNDMLAKGGPPLALSIDLRLQHMMKRELSRAIDEFRGIGGAGLILDVQTGEVLAMVSLPDFDPHNPGAGTNPDGSNEAWRNHATYDLYEMGSTFKVFNTAAVLETGEVHLSDAFDATHPLHIARFTIDDFEHIRRWMSVPEIFMYSSNIGSVQMAKVLGVQRQQAFLTAVGMTKKSPIELPEVRNPMVPHPWHEINMMTIAFGHGISVSPIQLASGVAAVANGGVLHPPTILKRDPDEPVPGTRILSAQTSELMQKLMRLQVVGGTGKNANVKGYLVGGKTGTAEKVTAHGGYSKTGRLSSFVGVFPMNAPRYLVMCLVDEPKPNAHSAGFATGGWVAAPAVGRIIEEMAPIMGIAPVDDTAPAIQEAFAVDLTPRLHRVAAR